MKNTSQLPNPYINGPARLGCSVALLAFVLGWFLIGLIWILFT
jgi:hypothetical protein